MEKKRNPEIGDWGALSVLIGCTSGPYIYHIRTNILSKLIHQYHATWYSSSPLPLIELYCYLFLSDNVPVTTNPFININNHQGGSSPQPPPRVRHNPFNKPASSHNLRSTSTSNASSSVPRSKLTFRELHNMYGRPILINHNEWRHRHKLSLERQNSTALISLWVI